MKKTILLVLGIIGILILSGFANTVISSENTVRDSSNGERDGDYPIGEIIWEYTIDTGWDNSPKAMAPISDINGDGIDDVIICSEDDYVRCFDGGANGTGVVLWEHEIYGGDIYSQKGLTITEDVNSDGYNDVVVGSCGGSKSIITLSGQTGGTVWAHDTHEYGDGGWVYHVACSYDYNDDGTLDVLAATGDDSSDTGPKRAYCLDGLTGTSIWEYQLGGPGFAVMGVEDFTGDGQPDVVAGASDEYETTGYAYGINGATGNLAWTFTAAGSSVWALEQIDDITSDGIKDVIVGDFYGNIYGLDATTGSQQYSNSVGSNVIIKRFEKINDVNGDSHPDIVPTHLGASGSVKMIDGYTGQFIWSHTVADKPAVASRIDDVSGDGINDLLVGTLFNDNYCYFLNGVNGSELASIYYGEALDAITAIPDVTGDGSMEMVAGGRDGKVTCFSGGTGATQSTQDIQITTLSNNWNFISLPFNQSSNKTDIIVEYADVNYTWYTAVTNGYINDYVFGWNRTFQSYNFADILEPGYGYWLYAYEPCELWIKNTTLVYDDYITDVEQNWNIISVPYNENVSKTNILINDILWTDAVTADIVNDVVFGWDRGTQSYNFADIFEPGYGYWLYAYQQCTLKRNI